MCFSIPSQLSFVPILEQKDLVANILYYDHKKNVSVEMANYTILFITMRGEKYIIKTPF